MKVRTRKKINSGIAAVCTAALLTAMLPGGIVDTYVGTQAEAAGDYYYAPTKLYDYKYDTEVNPNYRYTYTQSSYDGKIGGNRWQNGSQVPYEELNRAISSYYGTNASGLTNQPALYFGNFWGSSSDCTDSVQQQYTVSTDGNNSKTRYYSNNGYKNFWVAANNAPKAYNGYTPVRGLVNNTLNGFSASTVGSGTLTQGSNVALPQFDDTFIDSTQYADRCTVENGFPFDKNMDGSGFVTYSYDSSLGANRYYNATTQNFEVQNNSTYNYRSDSGIYNKEQGFYPFNGTQITSSDRTNVNYGFGMRIDIPFNLDHGQTVSTTNTANKKAAEFKFSGDDDIWVFIDGTLVLDLGGDHARVNGVINFAGDGSVKITDSNSQKIWSTEFNTTTYPATDAGKSKRADSCNDNGSGTIKEKIEAAGGTWSNDGDHVMTVFYMERGLFESNLKIEFTFTPKEEVVETEENNNDLVIREQTLFTGVNAGLLSQTKAAADRDVFQYSIGSDSTTPGTTPNYSYPTYTDINRVNSEAQGNPSTPLASATGWPTVNVTTTTPATDPTYAYVYFTPGIIFGDNKNYTWETKIGAGGAVDVYMKNTSTNARNLYRMKPYKVNNVQVTQSITYQDNCTDSSHTNQQPNGQYTKTVNVYVAEVPYSDVKTNNYNDLSFQLRYAAADANASASTLHTNYAGTNEEHVLFYPSTLQGNGWGNNDPINRPILSKTKDLTKFPKNSGDGTSGGTDVTETETGTTDTNRFLGDGTNLANNVTFLRTDPFTSSTLYGATNSSSQFYLLYGESAMFHKQFAKHSTETNKQNTITVGQLNTLKDSYDNSKNPSTAPSLYVNGDKRSDFSVYHQLNQYATTRTVSDYYTTTVTAKDTDGVGVETYQGAGNFNLSTPTSTNFKFYNSSSDISTPSTNGEKAVKITETFINTVKTTDLTIAKDYTTGSDPSKEFTFKISFNTIFGNADVTKTGDYSDVIITINNKPYKLTSDGEFTIKSDDTAIIRGIPVGTKYTLTEKTANTGYSNETFSISKNNGTATNNAGTAGTGTKTLENQTIDTDATNVTVTAKNALDATVTKVGLSLTKRWINADIEELKANGLQLVLQRKAKSDDGWKDVETITLRRNNGTDGDAASGDSTNNVKQSTEYTDYVWQYTKTNLLQYKGGDTTDPYTYRVLEMSQDGTSVLVASGGLYTEHCKVEYVQNEVDASTVAAEANMTYSLTNNYDIPASVPKAGAEGVKYIFTFGITAIALSGAALLIYKRKLKRATLLTETKGRYVQRENE